MPKTNGAGEKIIAAINQGRATSRDALCKASGSSPKGLASMLSYLRSRGRIEYRRDGNQIDFASLRLVEGARKPKTGRPKSSAGSTKGVAAATRRAKPRKPPVARRDLKPENRSTPTSGDDGRVVSVAALRRLHTYAQALADEVSTVLGSPSLASTLMELAQQLGAMRSPAPTVVPASTESAPRKSRARQQRRRPEGAPVASSSDEEEEPVPIAEPDGIARYRTVGWLNHGHAPELAEFCELETAERAFAIDKRAQKLIEIETGKVIRERGGENNKLPSNKEAA